MKHVQLGKHKKRLCDLYFNQKGTIRGLQTQLDAASREKLIFVLLQRDNHVMSYRTSQHLYRIFFVRERNILPTKHNLEEYEMLSKPDEGSISYNDVASTIAEMISAGEIEEK